MKKKTSLELSLVFMRICEDVERENIERVREMIRTAKEKEQRKFLNDVLINMEDKLRGMITGRHEAEKQLKALS